MTPRYAWSMFWQMFRNAYQRGDSRDEFFKYVIKRLLDEDIGRKESIQIIYLLEVNWSDKEHMKLHPSTGDAVNIYGRVLTEARHTAILIKARKYKFEKGVCQMIRAWFNLYLKG